MASDALLILQADGTVKTGSCTGASVQIPGVQRSRALYARIRYKAATNATGANSVQFKIQHGSTSGGTMYDHVVDAEKAIALSTTPQSGVIYLPISTGAPFINLSIVFTGSGTTPTINYGADISESRV